MLSRYLPILDWGRTYNRGVLTDDLMAAVIVTIMLIPQSLAYALLAGLPPVVGLYASIVPLFAYAIFGTSRTLAVGPVAVISLMTASAAGAVAAQGTAGYLEAAITVAMVSGVLAAALALDWPRFLANLLSHPVISGFITASGVLIATSQVKHILGVEAERTATFWSAVLALRAHIGEVHWPTVVLSAGTIGIYFALKRWASALPGVALALVAAAVGAAVGAKGGYAFALLPGMSVGSWPTTLPHVDLQMIHDLLGVAFAIAFLSLLESASIAKTLAAKAGDTLNVQKQMVSMGVAGIANAFGSGMPVSGSLTRSALNSSGARRR